MKNTVLTFITISVLTIICLVGIDYMIRKAISKPIALLQRDMGQVATGNLTIRTSYTSKDEQFKESAKEINHLIQSLQQDTQHTVLVMKRGTEKAVEGKESALTAERAMEDINRITSQIQAVSVAAEEISAATEEVNVYPSEVSEN
ncbi:HAMP domain-containing methyl-accepting chemotaxis protein [Bacillus cytotoxicus]|nr:HAMP domain-containing methyl-accepting chemotaxis protein [Bacillus cytotoxicus]MDH2864227.1 hypothetical protein [Bacillus cytotoxicus]MDH2889559.1 hypothetical protein [Bacillus cytotoxicus]